MNQFANDLYNMVQNIEFIKVKSNFKMQLPYHVKNIKRNPKFLITADKTNNLYEFTSEEYSKLLIENISKTYKKTTVSAINPINTEAKTTAKDLYLDERIEQYNQNQSFIILKDHKEKFQNNLKCRLINPAKSEKGIVRKHYIDHINKSIREN